MSFHGFPRYQPLGLTWILEHRHWLDFHQRLIDSGAMDTWLWLLFPFLASSWYLPGIAPHDYMLAEILGEIWGNSAKFCLGSFDHPPCCCKTEARWVESRQVVFHEDTTALQVLRHAILSSPRDQSIPGEFGSAVGRSWYLDNALWASNACEHQLQTSL